MYAARAQPMYNLMVGTFDTFFLGDGQRTKCLIYQKV
jgi:hypothetical protein